MALILDIVTATRARLALIFEGLAGLAGLIAVFFGCLVGQGGTLGSRLTSALGGSDGLRQGFAVLRAFLPNLALKSRLITAYPNAGTVVVTRFADVEEVLSRDADFEVVYAPRMEMITGGANFFLGMQDTPQYTRDVANMRLAVRRDDVTRTVAPFVARTAAAIVGAAPGRIDAPQDLTLPVPAQLLGAYFGLPGPSQAAMIDWTTTLFWYLFNDLRAAPALDAKAVAVAAAFRAYLDEAIADRKIRPTSADDVLNRCLAMQAAGLPGMDDLGVRNNLIGLMIGELPTLSKAAIQALDQLLDRPRALAAARAAALADDDEALGALVFEALRFNPLGPLIYRRAVADTVVAAGTLRACRIPKAAMVLAANLSAMFDPLTLDAPGQFRAGRPWEHYILWGYGLHTCFGAHINRVAIPALLKPLLRKSGLRRAPGPAGRIDFGGTPFPVHLVLEFDAA
jgi:cytochrome P450